MLYATKKTLTILLTFFLPKMAGRQALFRHDNCYSVGACSCFWQKLQLLMPSENVKTFFSSNEFHRSFWLPYCGKNLDFLYFHKRVITIYLPNNCKFLLMLFILSHQKNVEMTSCWQTPAKMPILKYVWVYDMRWYWKSVAKFTLNSNF